MNGTCSISINQTGKPEPIYRKMDFANPIVNRNDDNEFTTIRRGLKWSNLMIGEKIVIIDPLVGINKRNGEKEIIGKVTRIGTVTGVKVKRFMDLSWKDLNYNFQEGCASDLYIPKIFSLTAIEKTMKEVYPDFDYNEIVTWVKIKDSKEIE